MKFVVGKIQAGRRLPHLHNGMCGFISPDSMFLKVAALDSFKTSLLKTSMLSYLLLPLHWVFFIGWYQFPRFRDFVWPPAGSSFSTGVKGYDLYNGNCFLRPDKRGPLYRGHFSPSFGVLR
jgi:hypothetical protein